MNKRLISRKAAKARRVDKTGCHTHAGGYPGSQKEIIQQLVGQFDRLHPAFMPQSVAQISVVEKVQQPAALFATVQTGGKP